MAFDFREHQASNRRRTVAVLVVMFALLWSAIYMAGWLLGVAPVFSGAMAVIGALVYLAFTWSTSTERVLRAARARPANPAVREERLLVYKVEEMAIASGLPPPKVYVQDSRDINAFAAGLKPEASVVCFTTGALAQLDAEEIEGVVAHEMSHIRNRDIRLATITVGVVGAIAMVAEIGVRMVWFRGGGDRRPFHPAVFVLAIVFLILAPILSRLVYLALSRTREYLADASGAELTRNPEGLARALEKIKGDVPDDPVGSRTVAGLYFANPYMRLSGKSMFSTHPPLDERIRRLRQG